ncbi:MAG TPA: polysaccharide deacetylase family protein [Steroidobacteraceae bacterium]|nr:polysaccharide deacetylase family protein [Steroidobacteraceae bacterium]
MPLCRADKVLIGGTAAVLGSSVVFGATTVGLGLPLCALAATLADGIFRPASNVFYPTVSSVQTTQRSVALTFDDGPHPETTPRVLDLLAKYSARATFFAIGKHIEAHRKLTERIVAEGHELANHSWHHSYWQNFQRSRALTSDITRNADCIRSITGSEAQPIYRAPVGLKSPELARVAHALGLTVVAWSIHSRDTIDSDAHRIARRVLTKVRPGAIALLHDGHERSDRLRTNAVEALPFILEGLRDRQFTSVTVSELLASRSSNAESSARA